MAEWGGFDWGTAFWGTGGVSFETKVWQALPSTATANGAVAMNDLEARIAAASGGGASSADVSQLIGPRPAFTPVFTRLTPAPMYTGTTAAGASIFWPWVINVEALGLNPPAGQEYRLYESTDHDSSVGGNGGIFVRYASNPLGPWTNAAGTAGSRNAVYDPGGGGTVEVETPALLYVPEDPNGRPWYLYFQNIGGIGVGAGEQATWLVSSADGLTGWVAEDVYVPAIDPLAEDQFGIPDTTSYFGDGHTGYLTPFRIGQQFGAYHLLGGSDNAGYGISWSLDGKRWLMDPNIIRYQQHLLGGWGYDVRMSMAGGGLVVWHGLLWRIGVLTDAVSGAQVGARKIVMYPVAPDLKTILAPPTILLDPDVVVGGWETPDVRSTHPFVDADGTLYVFYITAQNMGVGRVDASPAPSELSGMSPIVYDSVIGADDFTATAGGLLTAHSPDIGTSWLQHPLTPVDMAISTANRLRVNTASTTSVHLLVGPSPASADYQVKAPLHYFTNAASSYGICGRFDDTVLTGYVALRNNSAAVWQILRLNAGTGTTLASSSVSTLAVQDYEVKLQFRGSFIRLLVDGVVVAAASDTAPITAIGKGGVRINGSISEAAGIHIASFEMAEA